MDNSTTTEEPQTTTANGTGMDADINPSGTIITSVSLYFPLFLGAVVIFELIRRKWEEIYVSRKFNEETKCSIAEQNYGILGWLFPVLRTSDEVIFRECGLDTYCFLRLLRMGQKFALCGIGLSIFLFPVYATGTNPRENQRVEIDPLERITMSNLSSREDRLWASVVAMYIMSFFALYLFNEEYKVYVKRRHEFLGREGPQQYSVVINYLPKRYRSKQTLTKYMDYVFPNTVRSVHISLECDKLESDVEERAEVRSNLEHAITVFHTTGKRPTHTILSLTGLPSPVDSIHYYQEKLMELNTEVATEIERLKNHENEIGARLLELTRDPSSSPEPESETSTEEQGQGDAAEIMPTSPTSITGSRKTPKLKILMRQSAFVSFTTLRSAQVAQQLLQTEDPSRMNIGPAPDPKDIVWENIGYSQHQRRTWSIASWLATFLIILFWTIPTTFVASLATVESIVKLIPALEDVFEANEGLKNLVKQISPMALVVMPILASVIFGILSKKEGHPSLTQTNASHFRKLVYFQTFQIFFVSVIAGTLFDIVDSLKHILDDPKSIIATLGTSLPTQSTNFMAYLIIQLGLKLSLELLRIVPICLGLIYNTFAPNLTPREQASPWYGLSPAKRPGEFIQTLKLADYFLAILLLFSFSVIAPLLSYFAGLYFLLSDIIYRRQLLFVYDPSKYSTGVYWPHLHNCLVGALLLAQVTFLGLVTLKVTPGPIFWATVLPFFTVFYYFYVKPMWPKTAKNLPLSHCVSLDLLRSGKGTDWSFLDKVYEQPALGQAEPIKPENRNENESEFELVPPSESFA